MAYMDQAKKAKIVSKLKEVIPAGWKYSVGVRHHSTLVFTLKQAPLDLLGHVRETLKGKFYDPSNSLNEGYLGLHNNSEFEKYFSGEVLCTFNKIWEALNEGNHDNSDPMTDYFDVGWYVDASIGRWDDPFLDTVPAPVGKRAKHSIKISMGKSKEGPTFEEYSQYLPPGWETMTPGRKAAATKRAKGLVLAA